MKNIKKLLMALFLISLIHAKQNSPVLLSYFPNFGNAPVASNENPYDKVTHYCWAFAGLDASGQLKVPRVNDLPEFIDSVKAHENAPLLSLGGQGSVAYFKTIMKDSSTFLSYIDTLVSFCENFGLSGVEVNWEGEALLTWDSTSGSAWHSFKKAYSDFVVLLGQKLHEKGMTIGVDVYGGAYYGAHYPGGDDSLYINTVDRMLVMTGGLHGKWELNAWKLGMGPQPAAAPPANFHAVNDHVNYWINRDVPAEKIICSFVSSLTGYNVKGAHRPGDVYDDLGSHCDDYGYVTYPKMKNLFSDTTFKKYGGGKQGSILYSKKDSTDNNDDELIFFNTFEDIRYATYEISKLDIGGFAYWMTAIDLPSGDSIAYVNAILEGMNSNEVIEEPPYILFPNEEFVEPSGTKIIFLSDVTLDHTTSSDSETSFTNHQDSITATINVAEQSSPTHWPGGSLHIHISDSTKGLLAEGMEIVMLVYKSNESTLFSLNTNEEISQNGWSHMVELPSTYDKIDTLLLDTDRFGQPSWTGDGGNKEQWLIDLETSKIFGVSFQTNGSFGKTTNLTVYEINGYHEEVGIGKFNPKQSKSYINQLKFNSNKISFTPSINGLYQINLYNPSGRKLYSQSINGEQGKSASISLPNNFSKGMHLLKISTPSKSVLIKKALYMQ